MQAKISYRSFDQFIINDNLTSTLKFNLSNFNLLSTIKVHCFNQFTHQSIIEILEEYKSSLSLSNNEASNIVPINVILKMHLLQNGVPIVRVCNIDDVLKKHQQTEISICQIRDLSGNSLLSLQNISMPSIPTGNMHIEFTTSNMTKYKNDQLSVYVQVNDVLTYVDEI